MGQLSSQIELIMNSIVTLSQSYSQLASNVSSVMATLGTVVQNVTLIQNTFSGLF